MKIAQPIIELQRINKYFGEGENRIHVLKDVDLTIEKGDFIAILGQSGSGKSTLMNLIGCLDKPTSGSYKIAGQETGGFSSDQLADLRSRTFGFIFQRYNLLGNLSALNNIALPAVYSGMRQVARSKRANELLGDLGLPEKSQNRPNELSGGQQQRVSIARALMNGGEVILADEPTGALDSGSGEMVMKILEQLHERGHTIIMVTHDRTIAEYAERTIEIKDGVIIADVRKGGGVLSAKYQTPEVHKRNFLLQRKDQFTESFRMSIQAIVSHKMRSLLTMLGIIIGIASVVTMVSLGQGTQEKILSDISALGTNTIDVYPGYGFGDARSAKVKTLTIADSEMLGQQEYLDSATPNASATGSIVYANIEVNGQLTGVGEHYFAVKGLAVDEGRLFSGGDVRDNASVVVIDPNTRDRLFPDGRSPLGEIIMFQRRPLEVIGVTQKQQVSFGPTDKLNLWVPYTTIMGKITGDKHIGSITVKVKDEVNSQMAEKNLVQLLTVKHGGEKDFFVMNSDSIKQTIQQTTTLLALFISCIAMISLIVGGIGVMNIMLVSVTERTREIGIRMAIGARQNNILEQFLIEAVMLCLIGGITGILLSFAVGVIASYFLGQFVSGMTLSLSTLSVVLAMGCSCAIGVVFGYLPARNAARLDPIQALSRD